MKPGKNTKGEIRAEETPLSNLAPVGYGPAIGNSETESFTRMLMRDFRLPLTAISNYCRSILERHDGGLDEQCKEYLLKIYDETGKMSHLVDTLLNSPPHKTQKRTRAEKIDLGEMAKAITEGLMLTKPERRVKFIVALDVMAGGDPGLLRIALKNLLSNAWKYTSHKEEALIEFGVAESDRQPAYFVRDNGIGFDMAEADKLFAPMCANHELERGGFGLDTVKKIIERHKGRVWAEGELGTGATFYFTLG